MARDPPFVTAKQRNLSHPYARGAERPSAFDRFPGQARNKWLNEIQAKIDRTLNPPSPTGPSRSPSPLEEDGNTLGVAQVGDDLGLSEEGDELDEDEEDIAEDEGYGTGEEQEGESYDEAESVEDMEDENPLGLGSQVPGNGPEDEFYDDEEDDEDEGIEDGYEEDESLRPQLPYSAEQLYQQHLEDEDPSMVYTTDPRLVDQWEDAEGEYNQDSEDLGSEENDDVEGEERDAEKENSITYIGDTDEEESQEEEEDEEDVTGAEEEYAEDDEEVEDEELDDDGMGGPDTLPLEEEGATSPLRDQLRPESSAIVDYGQVEYNYVSEAPFINPYHQESAAPLSQPSISGPSNLYPTLPDFSTTPAFTPASQMIPPWEPSPLDPVAIAAEALVNDLIDPSLLADFAQRVEAQASGDLGNTTESQNTEEMTALADAVMGQYNDTPEQILGTDTAQLGDIEVVQHGMGEAEDEGYEEDDGSRATSEEAAEDQSDRTCYPEDGG